METSITDQLYDATPDKNLFFKTLIQDSYHFHVQKMYIKICWKAGANGTINIQEYKTILNAKAKPLNIEEVIDFR